MFFSSTLRNFEIRANVRTFVPVCYVGISTKWIARWGMLHSLTVTNQKCSARKSSSLSSEAIIQFCKRKGTILTMVTMPTPIKGFQQPPPPLLLAASSSISMVLGIGGGGGAVNNQQQQQPSSLSLSWNCTCGKQWPSKQKRCGNTKCQKVTLCNFV